MTGDHSNHAERLGPSEVVAHMLLLTGRAIGQAMADQYIALAIDLEAYMGTREGILAWEELDVADFVRTTARGRPARIARCCNLAAVLCWAYGFGGARPLDIALHYDTLLRVCPRDTRAHAYIRWGANEARGIEGDPPDAVYGRRAC